MPVAPPCPPHIDSVGPITTQQNQTITINGNCLGTQAPFNGDSPYIAFYDVTAGNWSAGGQNIPSLGIVQDGVTLNVTSWTNTQIVIAGFAGAYGQNGWFLSPGDQVKFYVYNPQSGSGPATYTATVAGTAPSCSPSISSVSSLTAQQNQTITITGSCFGAQSPYNGLSAYIVISDITQNWNAGCNNNTVSLCVAGSLCPCEAGFDSVGLNVTSWTNSQIVIAGFTGSYGGQFQLNGGDQVKISVWNAQSGNGPGTYTTTASGQPRPSGPTVTYPAGWNLVGAPASTTLTGALGPIYTFQASDSNYETLSSNTPLAAGLGYWALFATPVTETLPLVPLQPITIQLPPSHWVMAGNPNDVAVNVSGADIVYTYSPTTGYTPATSLAPGQGAWIFSRGGGTLVMGVAPPTPPGS